MNEKEAVKLLKKYAPDLKHYQLILQHSKAVEKVAITIAKEIKANGHAVDIELVKVGSLIHDIGRYWFHPGKKDAIKHGIKGGEVLRKEGYTKLARIAERHIGVGITKKSIISQKLPLPKKDFVPKTIEEKIVTYADNLITGDRVATLREVANKFKTLPMDVQERAKELHNEIEKLRGGEESI